MCLCGSLLAQSFNSAKSGLYFAVFVLRQSSICAVVGHAHAGSSGMAASVLPYMEAAVFTAFGWVSGIEVHMFESLSISGARVRCESVVVLDMVRSVILVWIETA